MFMVRWVSIARRQHALMVNEWPCRIRFRKSIRSAHQFSEQRKLASSSTRRTVTARDRRVWPERRHADQDHTRRIIIYATVTSRRVDAFSLLHRILTKFSVHKIIMSRVTVLQRVWWRRDILCTERKNRQIHRHSQLIIIIIIIIIRIVSQVGDRQHCQSSFSMHFLSADTPVLLLRVH